MRAGPIRVWRRVAAEPDCAQIVPEDVGCGDLSDLVDFRISNLCVSYIRLRFAPPPGTKFTPKESITYSGYKFFSKFCTQNVPKPSRDPQNCRGFRRKKRVKRTLAGLHFLKRIPSGQSLDGGSYWSKTERCFEFD
jgi:hypothetical protein